MNFALIVLAVETFLAEANSKTCTYRSWQWNVKTRSTDRHVLVKKPYSALKGDEKHASGCTVCEEDQVEIKVDGLAPVKACFKFAARIEDALVRAQKEGFAIESLVAYRVGRSRGAPDANGLLGVFSGHSYGTAIDINAHKNGLYNNCPHWGSRCVLSVGGKYAPGKPGSITRDDALYRALTEAGWKWGGDWATGQKDFMHFSADGQ